MIQAIFDPIFNYLALMVIIIWPVIPLFWIPVHGFSRIFKKLGLLTYIAPVLTWTPLAILLFTRREFILGHKIVLPRAASIFGVFLLLIGTALQVWSARLLSLRGLMGMPEVSARVESRFVTSGPYRIVRHPTYLAHTLMFAGLFLMTGMTGMGMVTLLDALLVGFIVVPLEDRELSARFGPAYDAYQKKVPGFFPFHS